MGELTNKIVLPVLPCYKLSGIPGYIYSSLIKVDDICPGYQDSFMSMKMLDWAFLVPIKEKDGIDFNNLSTKDINNIGSIVQICDHFEDKSKPLSLYLHNAACGKILKKNNLYASVEEVQIKTFKGEKKSINFKNKLWKELENAGIPSQNIEELKDLSNITTVNYLLNHVMNKYGLGKFDNKICFRFMKEKDIMKKYEIFTLALNKNKINFKENCGHYFKKNNYKIEAEKRQIEDEFANKKADQIIEYCQTKIPHLQQKSKDTYHIIYI